MSLEKQKQELEFFIPSPENTLALPFANAGISAGFPSPAMDFMESKIDINALLIKHPQATFYARVSGNSMVNAGIENNDILVIDRSLEAESGAIAVCFLDGEFTLKRLRITQGAVLLVPENEAYEPIAITKENQFQVWGIVTYVIKKV